MRSSSIPVPRSIWQSPRLPCSIPTCAGLRGTGRDQCARVSGWGRAPSLALCAARTPQFSRISLRCWDLHIGTSIWHSPHSQHVRFPFSDLRGTGTRARTRGSAVAARRLSRALCAAARTLRSSRASACGVGTCILAPALANATVRSARGRRARDGSLVGRTQAPERSGGDGAARVTMRRTSGCTGTARQADLSA